MNLNNYIVQIHRRTKRITLQRFLVSKIAYGKDFSLIELAALFHNQLWLQTKCQTDVHFREKFGKSLEELAIILKECNFSRGLQKGTTDRMRNRVLALEWDFLIPQRNLPNLEAQLRNSITTKWRKQEGVEINKLPPKSFIGKGYRDHGTAPAPEKDGSPSWQEVGSEFSNLEREDTENLLFLLKIIEGKSNVSIKEQITGIKRTLEVQRAIKRIDPNWRNPQIAEASEGKIRPK